MRRSTLLFALLAIGTSPLLAATSTSVTSQIGLATCSQADPASSSCSQTVGFDEVTSTATASISVTAGELDAVVNADHFAGGANTQPSGTAAASFNVPLVVTGGTGTGTVVVNFFGFDDILTDGNNSTLPTLQIVFGSTATTYTPGAGGNFSFSTAFTYGTPFTFSASISDSAQAPLLMFNAAAEDDVEEKVIMNGFSIFTVTGLPANGTVSIAPEPSTPMMAAIGTLALAGYVLSRRKRCASE